MPAIIIANSSTEEVHRLGKRPCVIGRDVACTVQVLDEHVSRKHLQIRLDPVTGCYRLLDLKSENGTAVNDRRLDPASAAAEVELVDGDRIRIGRTSIYFTTGEFPDDQSALNHWRRAGERGKSTIQADLAD